MKKIFILHGWTYSDEKWQKFIQQVKEKGFDPVFLNVPGLTEKTDKVWDLDSYVEWLKEKLAGEEKPIVIAHSNGGRIALAYAVKYPEKLNRLVLIDSAGIYHNELPIRLKRFVFGTIAKIGKQITSSKTLRDLLYKATRESDYKNATPEMRQTIVNLLSVDLTPRLNKITTPTLIIWGRNDSSTPLSDAKIMNDLINNSKLHIIDDARHSPYFTHTDEVCRIIFDEVGKS